MHLFLGVRGIKQCTDMFIRDLQAQYFDYYKPDGENPIYVQLAVRPIQLYELVFPEQHLASVVKMIRPDYDPKRKLPPATQLATSTLRKALSAKPMPKDLDISQTPQRIIYNENVDPLFIGIKKDKKWPLDAKNGHPGQEQL